MEGVVLAGFRIGPEIARGGTGIVYRAKQLSLGRDVAVKVLRADMSLDPEMVERLKAEPCLAAGISHPHLVQIIEAGFNEGRHWYAMELVEGTNLARYVADSGPLGYSTVARIGAALAGALSALHAKGVIHRDVKPQNVLVSRDLSVVKLSDFGLAFLRAADLRLTEPGTILGTPCYMSPEQTFAHQADNRSDIYSLGAVLYETLTGAAPFTGNTYEEVMNKQRCSEPAPIRRTRPDAPEALVRIIARCMEKAPSRRYQSVDELMKDLEQVQATCEQDSLARSEEDRVEPFLFSSSRIQSEMSALLRRCGPLRRLLIRASAAARSSVRYVRESFDPRVRAQRRADALVMQTLRRLAAVREDYANCARELENLRKEETDLREALTSAIGSDDVEAIADATEAVRDCGSRIVDLEAAAQCMARTVCGWEERYRAAVAEQTRQAQDALRRDAESAAAGGRERGRSGHLKRAMLIAGALVVVGLLVGAWTFLAARGTASEPPVGPVARIAPLPPAPAAPRWQEIEVAPSRWLSYWREREVWAISPTPIVRVEGDTAVVQPQPAGIVVIPLRLTGSFVFNARLDIGRETKLVEVLFLSEHFHYQQSAWFQYPLPADATSCRVELKREHGRLQFRVDGQEKEYSRQMYQMQQNAPGYVAFRFLHTGSSARISDCTFRLPEGTKPDWFQTRMAKSE